MQLGKKFSDGVRSLDTGYSGNSSVCPITLRTDNFVDRTNVGQNEVRFKMKSNWKIGDRLLVSDQTEFDNAE